MSKSRTPQLDAFITAIQPGELAMVAGRPMSGKSALARQVALGLAEGGAPVAMFNYESVPDQLFQQIVAGRARIAPVNLRADRLSPEDHQRLSAAAKWINDLPVVIAGHTPNGVEYLGLAVSHLAAKSKSRVILIDYANALEIHPAVASHLPNREAEIAYAIRHLGWLAAEEGLAIIIVLALAASSAAELDWDAVCRLSPLGLIGPLVDHIAIVDGPLEGKGRHTLGLRPAGAADMETLHLQLDTAAMRFGEVA